jgi:putative nucleotidyltransferase with HDIG domain
MSNVERLIETQEFATLPTVASRILGLLEDDNVDIRDISRVIETDPSLTLKLLRVANSPLYATRTEVTSIHQAIITLGLSRLTNIVLGVSIFSKFLMSSNQAVTHLMEKFWWHASCTGMVAKSLSTKINKFYKENEFIGGLLHDIGKLAMIQFDSQKYIEVVTKVEKGALDVEAEKDVFGADHLEVGSAIAKLWKLPHELTNIITYHNDPENAPENNDLIAVVRLPDQLCEIWDAGFYEGIKMLNVEETESWQVLTNKFEELKDLDVEVFTLELEEDFRRSAAFLEIIASDI